MKNITKRDYLRTAIRKKTEHWSKKTKLPTSLTELKIHPTKEKHWAKYYNLPNKRQTLITARFRMQQCGRNFKGTIKENCDTCGCVNDEEHRFNSCIRFVNTNYHDDEDGIKFDTIFSSNPDTLRLVINRISKVWNVRTGNGSMHVT